MLVLPRQLPEVSGPLAEIRWVPARTGEEVRPRIARGAEQGLEAARVGLVRGAVKGEVVHVQLEAAVRMKADHLPHFVDVTGRAEGRHAHDLVLALVDLEAEERGERAVEEAERMGKPDLLQEPQLGAPAEAEARRRPLADAVDRQHGRRIEARAEVSAGGVGEVMLAEENAAGRD